MPTAKAIFLGGVTRRFPELRFAFLEGGVGWACQLFGDLIEHWERRSATALERMHPDKLDRAKLLSLVEKYGYDDIAAALRERGGLPDPEQAYLTGGIENIDDFSACKIIRKEDWVDLFAKPLLFRLRGRRPDERHRFWPQQPVRVPAECDLQLGYRAFRRDRHARSVARGL